MKLSDEEKIIGEKALCNFEKKGGNGTKDVFGF